MSWTVPTPESWHGFTFAIRTTERIEPTPSEGGAGGMGGADAEGVGGETPVEAGAGGTAPEIPTAGAGGADDPTPGGATGVAGDDDTGSRDRAKCNCGLPGVTLTSNAPAFAFAAVLVAALRRRRRKS